MPTYRYRCGSCGEEFEVWQSINDDALTTHDACNGPLLKVFSPAGIVLKGAGFYKNDSRSGQSKNGKGDRAKEKESTKSDSSTSTGSSESGSSSGSSSGKDSGKDASGGGSSTSGGSGSSSSSESGTKTGSSS